MSREEDAIKGSDGGASDSSQSIIQEKQGGRFSMSLGGSDRLIANSDCLVCRYLDQTNLNAAFVSGMKEDLNMYGLQLNYANTCWVVGYVIGQIPGNIMLTRFSPHYVVFALEFGWSLMTLCTTWITNYQQLYAIRFFVGLFEAAYYPGLHYLIGSWYSKKELGKRASLFQGACALGSLLSLVLQGGVHTTLNGKLGRPGWRWIFIIDAVISFPIAIGAFCMLPDLPDVIKPNWMFSQEEIDLARKRLDAEGRTGISKDAYTWAGIKSIFSTWHIYIFTAAYSLYIFMHTLPTYANGTTATGRWVLYYLTGMIEVGAGLIYAWAATVINTSMLLFKQTEQPTVFKGNVATSVAAGLLNVFIFLILYLSKRDERRAKLAGQVTPEVAEVKAEDVEDVPRQ
ncbi:hypothetical protein A1Q1_02428 [Trichosporon asahii var. asahii CBS 2479]|uniref:Major facilitator superfamily (MFS) profile domain-containing protein n=1 Tax=Trichosporon asahii var. asahii (strain ATCC 90039 / CBS 2479 / JCM 2466 / KCTC 7840 / NBRC 103889/ NCYC 2677 / UAMH 7654) TaxID=1186058 RepID=J4UC54_TRIAS|nr:hypothetical protein A1Q1_02428 [Trichosporon asahii var. asahii CBS 2479]EJT48520.1 hypothetical protein A1Q1_02428 [Trichosporon asahii var. asahii CBS 2479]